MSDPPRIMFLGNRRIAWEVLKLLHAPSYRDGLDVRVIVTDPALFALHRQYHQASRALFLSSDHRQSDQIRIAIKEQCIDMLLSIQYNWIIPADILSLVQGQAFNLHNARLPAYQGYHAIAHAIANGDTHYESTVHWMVPQVDCGDKAYVAMTPIRDDDTAVSLYQRTVAASVAAVRKLLGDMAAGVAPPREPQEVAVGKFYSRASIATLADVTGIADIDTIARIARAAYFPPYNTAFLMHAGRKYAIVPHEALAPLLAGTPAVNRPIA